MKIWRMKLFYAKCKKRIIYLCVRKGFEGSRFFPYLILDFIEIIENTIKEYKEGLLKL